MQATVEIEARVAYFIPQDNRMRHVYGNGWVDYQIEASTSLDFLQSCTSCLNLCNWEAFINAGYYQKSGRSFGCFLEHNHTRVRNWATNLGLLYNFDTCWCVRPYLGLGGGFVNVQFKDHSNFVKKHTDQWGGSILLKSGVTYDLTCNLFLDAFVDYTYHWYSFKKRACAQVRNTNTGGVLIGAGVGYKF